MRRVVRVVDGMVLAAPGVHQEDHVKDRNRKKGNRQAAVDNREDASRSRSAAPLEHRLRGNELAEDFVDADSDSSAAASHRVDKESDS